VATRGVLEIRDTTIYQNAAVERGGVILADKIGSIVRIKGSLFKENYGGHGGIVYAHFRSSVEIKNTEIVGNLAVEHGLAGLSSDGRIQFTNCTITENQGNSCKLIGFNI